VQDNKGLLKKRADYYRSQHPKEQEHGSDVPKEAKRHFHAE
jgi:hypothetical protein